MGGRVMADNIPPPPPGFVLQQGSSVPPPPPGYVLQGDAAQAAPAKQDQHGDGAMYAGRAAQISDSLGGSPLALPAHALNYLGALISAHTSPDSPLRKASEMVISNVIGAPMGMMHHAESNVVGIPQEALHIANAATGGNLQGATDAVDNFAKKREASYQAMPTNVGSVAGAAVGEALPWISGLGEARAAGLIPEATSMLGKLGTLAVEGGAMGAASPVNSGPQHQKTLSDLITGDNAAPVPSFASQKLKQILTGAATGPALFGLGKGASAIGTGVRDIAQHVMNPQAVADANVGRLFGMDPATVAKLRGAPQYVPGEVPSAAQVLANPEAVQAERMLRNNPASAPAFVAADNSNNAARQQIVAKLAGTPEEMQAAIAARKANAAPFITSSLTPSTPAARWAGARQALQGVIDSPAKLPSADFNAVTAAKKIVDQVRSGAMQEDDALQELGHLSDSVSTQKAQGAFGQAMQAIDKGMVDPSGVLHTIATLRNGPLGVNPKVSEGLDFLHNRISSGLNTRGKVGTDILDAVRQQASKLLGNAKGPIPGVGTQQGVALGPVKNQIVDAIERVAPGYRDYVAGYSKDSAPINTMASVSKLADPNAPGSLNATGDPQLAVSRLRQVLRGDDKAKFPMSSDARQQLDQVRQSLLRRTISDNQMGASGPGTAADLQTQGGLASLMFGKNMGAKGGTMGRLMGGGAGAVLGSHFGPAGTVLGSGIGGSISDALGAANSRVIGRVGATAANAGLAADAIERAAARAKASSGPSMFDRLLFGAGEGTSAGTQPHGDASPASAIDPAAHDSSLTAMMRKDPAAAPPLPPNTPIDASHSIPLGGGVSKDGSTIYIDKRIPRFVTVDGVKVDAHDVIAHAHEAPEFPQMMQGKNYLDAHNVNANTYEKAFLRQKYGVSHEAFNKALEPYLKAAEAKGANASDVPRNLDATPYIDSGTGHLIGPGKP